MTTPHSGQRLSLPDIIYKMLMTMHFNPAGIHHASSELYSLITSVAMRDLIERLPEDKRKSLNHVIINPNPTSQSKKIVEFIHRSYREADIHREVIIVAQRLLSRYVTAIGAYITPHQREAIASLIAEIYYIQTPHPKRPDPSGILY